MLSSSSTKPLCKTSIAPLNFPLTTLGRSAIGANSTSGYTAMTTPLQPLIKNSKLILRSDWTYFLRALALAKTGNVQNTAQSPAIDLPSSFAPALEDLTQAIQLAQTNYEKDPNAWQNNFNLALYHLAAGHNAEAQTLYEAGLNNAPAWAIGMAYRDLRDYLRLFPTDQAASHWCDRLHLP
jgi:tetratricopeptide (TPR) repeat protein